MNGSQRSILLEQIDTAPKLPSTDFSVGMWLENDGSGHVEPLTPSTPVKGLCLEKVLSTDTDYASDRQISFDGPLNTVDRWLMPVTTGTAVASMIGSPFDVDSNSFGLDVSGSGTQFEITQVISADLVEVRVLLTA